LKQGRYEGRQGLGFGFSPYCHVTDQVRLGHRSAIAREQEGITMPHYAQGTTGWTKLKEYQAIWDPKIDLGKFYFTTFQGKREETPYMTAENFARVIDILRNEDPVYGNASTPYRCIKPG
jgi:hypothetical protein